MGGSKNDSASMCLNSVSSTITQLRLGFERSLEVDEDHEVFKMFLAYKRREVQGILSLLVCFVSIHLEPFRFPSCGLR